MTSARVLRERQYAGPENLEARQALWSYRSGAQTHAAARLAALELVGNETVFDVGCGSGTYLSGLRRQGHSGRLLGVDLSLGMARAAVAASEAVVAVADATWLPVATGAADAALAMHMLHHVPHPPAAIAELRRVVRPSGTLLASTNGHQHINEVLTLISDAVRTATGRNRTDTPFGFTLETGAALLSKSFAEVTKHEHVEQVRVPHAELVIDYVASFGPEHIGVAPSTEWEAFLAAATDLVHARIGRDGSFPVTSHAGYFLCR